MIYKPEMNDGKHIFVFGSNLAGVHGAGAAKEALEKWGAQWGIGEGRTGQSYALPTKDVYITSRFIHEIFYSVGRFKDYASTHLELTFLVTAVGCGLAGFTPHQIAPMFHNAPANCVLPDEFKKVLAK